MKKQYINPVVEITLIQEDSLLQTVSRPQIETTVPKDFDPVTPPDISDTPSTDGEGANDSKPGAGGSGGFNWGWGRIWED